jgi:hypothetical protein
MKITQVTYRTNRASRTNKFVHEHVELQAEIGKGETAEQVIEALRSKAIELLYPELVGLCARLHQISPIAAKTVGGLDNSALGELYASRSEVFETFLQGEMTSRHFLQAIGLGTIE